MSEWHGTVLGEPASKANSRQLKWNFKAKRNFLVKSDKAIAYRVSALEQIKPPATPILGDVSLTAKIFYASRRPDLDESLIMDILQEAGVIKNDRQIKIKHIYWGLDKANPRSILRVKERSL